MKRKTKQRVQEEEDEINWCPYCGEGSLIMNDPPCKKCAIPGEKEYSFGDDFVSDDDEELQKLIAEYMGDD